MTLRRTTLPGFGATATLLRSSRTARQPATVPTSSVMPTIAATPPAKTRTSNATPGSGSASRASPIGMSGEASVAPTTARAAPTTAITSTGNATATTLRLGRAEPPERREVGRAAVDEAAQRDTHDHEPGERHNAREREQPRRHHVDGLLDRALGFARRLDLELADRVAHPRPGTRPRG